MKFQLLILTLMFFNCNHAQSNLKDICGEFQGDQYFPLDIQKKKIIWKDTFYNEILTDTVVIENKSYTKFVQNWEDGSTNEIYLRKEDGMIRQYEECCEYDTTKLPDEIIEGAEWLNADFKKKHVVLSLSGKLSTPFCDYEDLLVVKVSTYSDEYNYFYKKGIGFVGATEKGKLVSYISPH